ncbi:hypothetical protein CC2G_009330 [Coprinopsis cinerea AmutBmut pab1-1]|nr:hypothetical protein CC2G_009330 [Coprinopsis cinerea AmutBmut pab1-1]
MDRQSQPPKAPEPKVFRQSLGSAKVKEALLLHLVTTKVSLPPRLLRLYAGAGCTQVPVTRPAKKPMGCRYHF